MSNFAFGTYRVSEHNPQHIEALKEAIRSGVDLIDTSTNYMDGSAETAIGNVLDALEEDARQHVQVVSKYGYIQGTTLNRFLEGELVIEEIGDVVEYSESCYHCIAPSFMRDQLSHSLERLNKSTIECYLIHNPEYYLLDAIKNGVDKDTRLDEIYKRLYDAFVALELEVQEGRINSYGISSNSFSKPHMDDEFLPYEDLLTLAEEAAYTAGNDEHSFSTIQLPINILERDGLACASWAKENGLRVLVNRPLNAQYQSMMFRLADYDESHEYYHHLNELLEVCDNQTLQPLFNLIEQLDANKHKFGWVGDYESFLYTQMIPHIKQSLEVIDEQNQQTMLNFIELFLAEYKQMVLHECARSTRVQLKEFFADCHESLQECALKYLLENTDIDYILVGMRKPSYVHDVLSVEA